MTPTKSNAHYKAGEYLHAHGPQDERALLDAVSFGFQPAVAKDNLQRAIQIGWLKVLGDGRIDLSREARVHFEGEPVKPVGQMAGPRIINVMDRKPYVPPKRMVRPDALDNSLAAIPSFYGKARP